ncbi:MAG TPA: chitobiase/beta-hexosaminidase C-terminal domain-containing protein, partial [Candidatus Limnocylindria bacterium]|nr:chitobiase/beta-hexosaminidase C-terminal domain-containing protein [Candidatus Limnocylindria bacterium]
MLLSVVFLRALSVQAHQAPPGCSGSGLGLDLFAEAGDVHIGETIFYSVIVFNGEAGHPKVTCDATEIKAAVVTPDGKTNTIELRRTSLANGDVDFYPNVVSYVVRAHDIRPDGTVRATAFDYGAIHMAAPDGSGGGYASVNSAVVDPFALVLTSIGAGAIKKDPDHSEYGLSNNVTLTAIPGRYYAFSHWSDGVTTSTRVITVQGNDYYSAVFTNTMPLERVAPVVWQGYYGGYGGETGARPIPTRDGGAVILANSSSSTNGTKTSPAFGGYDYWLFRISGTGQPIWDHTFGGSGGDLPLALLQTEDGGYLLGGQSSSGQDGSKTATNFGQTDFWIVKTDGNGQFQWDRSFGGSGNDSMAGIAASEDGGYLLAGTSNSSVSGSKTSAGFGGSDFWIVKTDSEGTKVWDRSFGGSGTENLASVLPTDDGGYLLGGTSNSGPDGNRRTTGFGGMDYWVVKTDSEGKWQWEGVYGGSNDEVLIGLQQTDDGGFLLAGYSASPASGNKSTAAMGGTGADLWVVKIGSSGVKEWDQTLGGTLHESGGAVFPLPDGGFLLGGTSYSGQTGNKTTLNIGDGDMWLVNLNSVGTKRADFTFGTTGSDGLQAIIPANDGTILLAGQSNGGGLGGDDLWLVKALLFEVPVGAPIIRVGNQFSPSNTFTNGDSASVTIQTSFTNASIYYSLDGTEPTIGGPLTYDGAFTVTTNATVRALSVNLDDFSTAESDPVSIVVVPSYPLLLTTAGGGTVTKLPSVARYLSNSVVTITATPSQGWTFLGWTGDTDGLLGGSVSNSGTTNTIVIHRTRSVQAVFGTTLTANVAVASTGTGTVQFSPANGPYPFGSVVQLTPRPAIGSYFSQWGSAASGNANPLGFPVTTPNRTVSVLFSKLSGSQVNLYLDVVGDGSVTASPAKNLYAVGDNVTLVATPNLLSQFDRWGGDRIDTTNVIRLLLDSNKSVTANFSPVPPGTVVAWGDGQKASGLGEPPWGQSQVPNGLRSVIAIGAGVVHSVALKADGSVVAWGYGNAGQVFGPEATRSGVTAIAAGGSHTVVLKDDGSIVVWGSNSYGVSDVPESARSGIKAVAAGHFHVVALKNDGSVVAWGDDSDGQTDVPEAAQSGITAIAAGDNNTMALKSDGSVLVWGKATSGQTSVPESARRGVKAIAIGAGNAVALKSDGSVVAWGSSGQSEVPAEAVSGVTAIAAGGGHTVALKSDNTVVAWGRNDYGQATVPVGLARVTAIAAGSTHTMVIIGDARGPVPPFIIFHPASETVTAGSDLTFSVTVGGSSPLGYQWLTNGVALGGATNSLLSLPGVQFGQAGIYTVVVTNVYGAVTSAPAVLTVKLGQTIDFGSLIDRSFGTPPFTVDVTASSHLPVLLSVNGPASLSGNTLSLLGAGRVTLHATQAGDATYAAAPPVEQSFSVSRGNQSITFYPLEDRQLGTQPLELNAIASSGLPVRFTLVSGPATLAGSTLTVTNTGTVKIWALQPGDANYNSAPAVEVSFKVFASPPVYEVHFASDAVSFGEGAGVAEVRVQKTGGAAAVATVVVESSSAQAGRDFAQLAATPINLPEGAQDYTFKVPLIDDYFDEGPETFQIRLSKVEGVRLGSPSAVTVTIVDNDTGVATGSLRSSQVPDVATGSLRVDLARTDGRWRLGWERVWHRGGEMVSGLPPGNYPVVFLPLADAVEP